MAVALSRFIAREQIETALTFLCIPVISATNKFFKSTTGWHVSYALKIH